MGLNPKEAAKAVARAAALLLALPSVLSYYIRRPILGGSGALEGSTQALALLPGLLGQYIRRAFLSCTLASCHKTVTVAFGTIFSQPGARLDENVYIGPGCHLGWVHLEQDVLVAAGVHIPSGPDTHGTTDPTRPIREQPGKPQLVRIGAGTWIGSGAIVMADVGPHAVVAAGSVVTTPLPGHVVAAGVPARVIRERTNSTR